MLRTRQRLGLWASRTVLVLLCLALLGLTWCLVSVTHGPPPSGEATGPTVAGQSVAATRLTAQEAARAIVAANRPVGLPSPPSHKPGPQRSKNGVVGPSEPALRGDGGLRRRP